MLLIKACHTLTLLSPVFYFFYFFQIEIVGLLKHNSFVIVTLHWRDERLGTCQCSTAGIRRLRDRSKAVRCRQTVKGSSINGLIALYSPTAAKRIDGKIKPWRLERIKYLVSRHLMRSLEVDSGCDKLPPRPVLRFVNVHRQANERKPHSSFGRAPRRTNK